MTGRAMGSHQSAVTGSDVWLTPPDLLHQLGPFDLDPCAAPPPRPWPTADRHIALPDDGLSAVWQGRVWLNPPYSDVGRWLGRLAAHGQGTALIFARTETALFARYVWREASAVLFLTGRITFCQAIRAAGSGERGSPFGAGGVRAGGRGRAPHQRHTRCVRPRLVLRRANDCPGRPGLPLRS